MKMTNSILEDIRRAMGLMFDAEDFDTDLLLHINSAISKLNQNGIGMFIVVTDNTTTWFDLKDESQVEGNKYFSMVPQFIALNVKILFDPPPPSSVDYHSSQIDQLLWRLKLAYELE